jgi:hypothetical protein
MDNITKDLKEINKKAMDRIHMGQHRVQRWDAVNMYPLLE